MPNWCGNILNICGPSADVNGFIEACKVRYENKETHEEWTIIESLYPIPDSLKNLTARFGIIAEDDPDKEIKEKNLEMYGYVDWYEWCIANWGTKWPDCHTHKVFETDCIPYEPTPCVLKKVMFRFDSAWSPPVEAFNAIALMFPTLLFDLRYEEPGMCFQGFRTWSNGELQNEEDMVYMQSGDDVYDSVEFEYDNYYPVSEGVE